jgi:hypothetical protein
MSHPVLKKSSDNSQNVLMMRDQNPYLPAEKYIPGFSCRGLS